MDETKSEPSQPNEALRESNPATDTQREPGDSLLVRFDSAPGSAGSVPVSPEVAAPETPRSFELHSSQRPWGSEDSTLLSAPTPATSFELETEDRLTRLERDFSRVLSRVESLESENRLLSERMKGSSGEDDAPSKAHSWRIVVLWLLGLVLLAAYGLLK